MHGAVWKDLLNRLAVGADITDMVNKEKTPHSPSFWQRFLLWLDGSASNERVRIELPKTHGDTDILLSDQQRKKLQDAVDTPMEHRWDTSFYSRDTQSYRRGDSSSKKGDGLII